MFKSLLITNKNNILKQINKYKINNILIMSNNFSTIMSTLNGETISLDPNELDSKITLYKNILYENILKNEKNVFEAVNNKDTAISNIAKDVLSKRINGYYIPTYVYMKEISDNHYKEQQKLVNSNNANDIDSKRIPPFFLGISAPQGCGKTSLTDYIKLLFATEGKKCVVMSLDDFYLTGHDQDILAKASPNPLLKFRGNAGTHDLDLINETFDNLKLAGPVLGNGTNIITSNTSISIPRYDKSLRSGRGDRANVDKWDVISHPIDIVLFEGWMLGFKSICDENISNIKKDNDDILEINSLLKSYKDMHELFDSWLVLAVDDIDAVYRWRLQAEHHMTSLGKPGMTDEQVHDFVSRFMPAYKAYLSRMYTEGPEKKNINTKILQISVDSNRMPISAKMIE